MSSLIYGAALLVVWGLGVAVYNLFFHPLRGIPGPFLAKISGWWLFALELTPTPHQELFRLHHKYGPIMRISPNEVSFNDIEASETIYAQTSKFDKSRYFYRAFENPGPHLFSICDRQEHSQDKKLISYAMSRANITSHESSMYDKATFLMDRIAQRAKVGQTIPLFPIFRCMTLDTISDFAFGKPSRALHLEDFHSPVFEAIEKGNGTVLLFQHFPLLHQLLNWAIRCNLGFVPNGFKDLIRSAEEGIQNMDSIGLWTLFKDMVSRAEKSTPLTKEHLVGEGMLMIVAGTDTTAASLSLTLHSLLQQPETYRKLQDEIRTVMPSLDSRPTIQALDTLPLLDACLKEGLRIASPVQCRLPREVNVCTSPWYFHYNKDVFPDPTRYNPYRWLVEGEQKKTMLSYFQPFSKGRRQCIGQK
ncbi:cytochrome P450 [Aspergillus pseudodeflectus]|uniref:Cytochrome P450 n=1 Tax=Aspergillus pseudodeflectus TaxID=176178 RepID=A0ABR4JJB7_9EURO